MGTKSHDGTPTCRLKLRFSPTFRHLVNLSLNKQSLEHLQDVVLVQCIVIGKRYAGIITEGICGFVCSNVG